MRSMKDFMLNIKVIFFIEAAQESFTNVINITRAEVD